MKNIKDYNLDELKEEFQELGEKPYRIQKTRELTRYYSEQELRTILRKLADMDLKIKSSDVDGNFLIELFILEQT